MSKQIKQRVTKLVKQIETWVKNTNDKTVLKEMEMYLNDALDRMNDGDMFGTEGQNDPRGDQRG